MSPQSSEGKWMPMGCPVDALTCLADCKLQCTPEDRARRSQRCDRCIKFGYPCSANATAQGIQRRVSHADDATLRCSAEIPSQMAKRNVSAKGWALFSRVGLVKEAALRRSPRQRL